MRKLFILILTSTLFIFASFIGENNSVNIWIQQTTINKAIDFENSLSKNIEFLDMDVSLSKSIYPLVDEYKIAKPVIVKRQQTGFLPLYVEYFYSEPDSIIRLIGYDWERDKYGNFFKKQAIWKEESKKLKEYNSEYQAIKSILVEQLGEPTRQDSEPQQTHSASGGNDYLSRNTVWETDEYYSRLHMVFESVTYRIRWQYYWKK